MVGLIKNGKAKFLAALVTALILMPPQLLAAAKRPTVILVPVGPSGDSSQGDRSRVLTQLRNKLKKNFNFLSLESVTQLKKYSASPADPKLAQALHLMNDSLETYNTFKSDAETTIFAMDTVIDFIKANVAPSAQASDLMVSAIMTKAWLLFEKRKKNEAKNTILEFAKIAPHSQVELDYYPPRFRRFFKQSVKDVTPGTATLTLRSTPTAVDVFIDHIFVGQTPITLSLPQSKYQVGFAAAGRRTVTKSVNLKGKNSKTLTTRLAWNGGRSAKTNTSPENWNGLKQSTKMVFAAQISRAANADKSIFFSWVKKGNGLVPQATVYDARYGQMMKPISFPRGVTDLKSSGSEVSAYFAKKLKPVLNDASVTYWSNKIDKQMIVDHRVASKGKKPLYKKPWFWAVAVGLVATTTTTAILLSNSASSSKETGGVTVSFDGL